MGSFDGKTSVDLPEHFVGLPVTGIQFMPKILLRLHFGLFDREGSERSRLTVAPMQIRVGFVLKPCCRLLFCMNSIFLILVQPRSYIFVIIRHTESFLSSYPSNR